MLFLRNCAQGADLAYYDPTFGTIFLAKEHLISHLFKVYPDDLTFAPGRRLGGTFPGWRKLQRAEG